MGFWDITKRMIQGKPAFETPPPDTSWDDDAPTADFSEERAAKRTEVKRTDLYDGTGTKRPPIASLIHTKGDLNGAYYNLWATIKNQSDRDIMLDKITLLGSTLRITYPLGAGEQREFHVYHGPRLTHDHYNKAELYYKDVPTGDYFRADHYLHYKYDMDGTYEVVEFNPHLPIRDV